MLGLRLLPVRLLRQGKDREYYKIVKDLFGIRPNNIELYKLALVHRSASVFLPDSIPINNERLEFLGDAVIESIVSDFLFVEFPEYNEGSLTQLRSRIVSRQALNQLAIDVGLDKYLVAQGGGNFMQKHIYGDALEAIIGAVYLDKGYDYANRILINNIFRTYLNLSDMTETEIDFKSRLLEWGHKMKRLIVFETGQSPLSKNNVPHFVTSVSIDGVAVGSGQGRSKKEAEQDGAQEVVEMLKGQGEINGANGNHVKKNGNE